MKTRTMALPNDVTVGEFYPKQVKALVETHRKLRDHPLYLALWYDTDDTADVHLLEVLGNFPHEEERGKLYTVEFESSLAFPLVTPGRLFLTLADPAEVRAAIRDEYRQISHVREAFARGAADVIYCASTARDILKSLKCER
jgi:hypothetical protein